MELPPDATGEGQRQHRDFEGEGKGFEVVRPKSKSPGVISPGALKGRAYEGCRGMGAEARPASGKRTNGEAVPHSRKKIAKHLLLS
jgi:hypothetical protein